MPEHTPAPTPSRAVYGFAMYLSFKLFFILYLLWAMVPEEWFKYVGITCLPQRYWAVTVPIFLLTVMAVFAFVIYPSLGLFMTPNVDDLRTIQDAMGTKRRKNNLNLIMRPRTNARSDCSCITKDKCSRDDYERNCGDFVRQTIPALQDLNIWEVSDHLYT